MDALPLHPAVVHLPLGLAVLMPLLAAGFAWAAWTGRVGVNAWLAVIALQAVLVGSGYVAMQAGHAEEARVEKVVDESMIHEHEELGEQFVWGAGATLALAVLVFVVRVPRPHDPSWPVWSSRRSSWPGSPCARDKPAVSSCTSTVRPRRTHRQSDRAANPWVTLKLTGPRALAGFERPCSAPTTVSSPPPAWWSAWRRPTPAAPRSLSPVWRAWWPARCRWRPANTSR